MRVKLMATLKPSWLRFVLGLGWVRLGLRLTNNGKIDLRLDSSKIRSAWYSVNIGNLRNFASADFFKLRTE